MKVYSSSKVKPYVYWCEHKETKEFYIGYHETNKLPSHLDLPKYKTSSKIVKPIFDEFNYWILAEFEIGDDAYDFEQLLIFENWSNSLLLNKSCHYGKKARFKTQKGIKFGPMTIEYRKKISKTKTGITQSDKHRENIGLGNKGKKKGPQSAEHLRKLSLKRKGRKLNPWTDEQKKNFSLLKKGQNKGKLWSSARRAAQNAKRKNNE